MQFDIPTIVRIMEKTNQRRRILVAPCGGPGTCAANLQTTRAAHENDVTLMTATGQADVLDLIIPAKVSIEEKLPYLASQIGVGIQINYAPSR